jgi:hypothetical protein
MKLADLRKLAIRNEVRIHFRLRNGLECVVSEQGIAQVPGLKGKPDFNLEEELASATEFLLDPVSRQERKQPVRARSVSREELFAMAAAAPVAAAPAAHDDE